MNTELSDTFFSPSNMEYLQGAIRESVFNSTQHTIGRQNNMDLYNLMKKIYTDYYADPTTNIAQQVSRMNSAVVTSATRTISTGIIQQLIYLRDISTQPVPPSAPKNTRTYGLKLSRN